VGSAAAGVSNTVGSAAAGVSNTVGNAAATARTEFDQFDGDSTWGGDRKRIGLGAAAVLAIGASAITAIVVRRRAQARANRMAWLALRAAALSGALPGARQAAPYGGAGGALLAAILLLARLRAARTPSPRPLDDVSSRVAQLQAFAEAQVLSDRPRTRDVLLGAGIGLGLAGLFSRRPGSRSAD
jgi:hypothetical protein